MEIQQSQDNQNITLFKLNNALYIGGLLLLLSGLIWGIVGIWQYVVYGEKTEWLLRVLHSHSAWIAVVVILFASVKGIIGETHKKVYLIALSLIGIGATMGFILLSLYNSYHWPIIETSLVRIHTHMIFYSAFLVMSLSLLSIINASQRAKKAVICFYAVALTGLLIGQSLFVFKGVTPILSASLEGFVFLAHLTVIYQLIKFLKKKLSSEERVFGIFWLYCFTLIFCLTAVGVSLILNIVLPTQYVTEHGLHWYDKGLAFRAIEDLHLSPISWFTSGIAISLGILALRLPITFQVFSLTLLALAPTINAIGRIAKVISLTLPDAGAHIFGSGAKFGIAALWLAGQPMKVLTIIIVLIYTIWWIKKSKKSINNNF